ncbi:hypothetical protein ACTJJ7_19465 [Phyllobacterium sp. 22229]|uniref:hypothetical protein n=1 Tax=Phyllobacterium sp. 22229 TaxID=3453895 RepID=UPI003F83F40F
MGNVTVKSLEWWEPDHTNNYTHGAKTIIGTYYVHIDGGRHVGCMETFVNDKIEQWEGPERGHLYEAQSDCFSDYEARILSALSVPCLQEPAGLAGNMPGTSGFTMATFEAAKVPVGTHLYAQPIEVREQAIRECAEIANRFGQKFGQKDEFDRDGYCREAAANDIADDILALLEGR